MAWKKQFTSEEKAAYREKKRADMEALFKRIDEGVQQVFTSDKYKAYLKFMSKFTDYSARNTLLIAMQKPDATLVAAYGKWKQLGRQVNKGASGIEILAPVAFKTNMIEEIERPVVDEFGNRQYNPDGTEKTEILEKPVMDLAFKKVYVFDVSQTSGKELPEPVQELSGDFDSDKKDAIIRALERATGIRINFADIKGGAKGFYSPTDDKIVVQSGMSDAQMLKTAFHECAHKLLHDPSLEIATAKSARNEKEVQAESTAFIVAEWLGLDTSEYSFPYIASWSDGKQLDQLTKVLDEIQQAAKKLTSSIESELLKLQKRDLTMDEMLADTELNNIQKAEILIDDCKSRNIIFSKEDQEMIFQYAGEHEDIAETVRLIADMEMTCSQITPAEEIPQDITQEEYMAAMNFDAPNFTNTEGKQMNHYSGSPQEKSGVFGNTPYAQLGERSQLEYYKNLKPRHADNIARQLEADGVRFSGKHYGNTVTITVNKTDIPRYLAAVDKVKAGYAQQRGTTNPQPVQQTTVPSAPNPNVFGNTPYTELGDKSQLQYMTKLKPRHAENIAKQLEADGVPFSGVRKGYSVTITVRKADVPRYEAAVAKVKASYSKTAAVPTAAAYFDSPQGNVRKQNIPEKHPPADPKDVPIVTISFVEARQNDRLNELWDSIHASQACRDYIDQNLYDAYENRNLKGFVQELEQKFGMERTMYTVAATIQLKKHDGRFTPEVRNAAARFQFDSDQMRLKFLTEQHPVRLNHLFEVLIDRSKELAQEAPKPELPHLSEYLSDQFLLSTERVSVRDDYRGIPETSYFNSSVNEYFVDGIGWLDNDAYDREQKMSGETAKQFYSKVTKINAACVNADGTVSNIDMTRQEYDLLTDRTYSPENRQALEMAKAKLAERKENAGITPKPVEQYAVRQSANSRYAIVTISADGLVTPVIPNMASVAEAKKAMLELFEQKKKTVRCELVHPQVLDEKSAELYKEQSKELPDVVYRIQVSKNQATPDTHYVQQYVKNDDDTYKIGEIMAKGDYFACNAALSELLANPPEISKDIAVDEPAATKAAPAPPVPPEPEHDFAIYQLKPGDETRDIRFEPYERLAKHGQQPDLANYNKVYEGNIADISEHSDQRMQLEAVFYKFNMERPDDFKGHSLSVSDVVTVKNQAFYVDSFGFKPLPDFLKLKLATPEIDKPKPKKPKL
ncbi:YodL domain-containing protein [Ruminococcus sp. XPD3002]|uniref:YodL domain-containing protein n=1 Tax=Ruminococcus sp. XPD3002 TaxID=1452269 RepID=UPI000920A117|nr:Antirestriction protein ArdC [Ruminococcus flavefaciens]